MAKLEIKADFSGLEKELKRISKAAENLSGEVSVSLGELYDTKFMVSNTNFSDLDALFTAGGFDVNDDNFEEVTSSEEFNAHIRSVTKFSSWDEMQSEAAGAYAAKKLGF